VRWTVGSERPLYQDEWLDVRMADVRLPDGRHLAHRLIRVRPSAGAVVLDDCRRVLLMWRHRFITGSWGWEIPMGRVEDDEDPMTAAARETEAETGWRPGPLHPLLVTQPANGISDAEYHIFLADSAAYIGPPADPFESDRIDWVSLADVPDLIAAKDILCGGTQSALLFVLACGDRLREHGEHFADLVAQQQPDI
jgi:8-oxo-dGTP pyrophosphatase MutT (NUDIX family)